MNGKTEYSSGLAKLVVSTLIGTAILAGGTATAQEISFDGLVAVDDARVAMAYIDPEADFSVFERVMILDPHVSFRSNWRRDQNRSRSRNIRASDVERIKADVAALFKEVIIEVLEADDGYEIVDTADYDVLLLRPAIIDLDISAPDTRGAGRTRTYASSTGAATLYLELFDSVSGAIIGRAADRQAARRFGGTMTWNNRVTNRAEARRVFRDWATKLREFLDEHYSS